MRKRNHIRLTVTCDFLVKAAKLPDDVEIVAVRHEPFRDSIELFLSCEGFASVPEGTEAPHLTLGSWRADALG